MHDTSTVPVPDHRQLYETAEAQSGYFTAAQARAAGVSAALLAHHVRRGGYVRVRRGLYRIRDFPPTPRESVMVAWLAVGRDIAVVSHDSALDLHGLSDVIPEAVHLTVGRPHRYLKPPPDVRLHVVAQPPAPDEIVYRDGIAVTSVARTIADAAADGTAPEQIRRAVREALQRGLSAPAALEVAIAGIGARAVELVRAAIAEVAA
jgi:predicted transcriptional regulator of viral defense system